MSNEINNLDDTISDNSHIQEGGYTSLILNSVSPVSSYYTSPYYTPINPIQNIAPDYLSATSSYIPTTPIRIPLSPRIGVSQYVPYSDTSYDFSQWQMNNLLSSVSSNIRSNKQNNQYIPVSMDSLNHRGVDNVTLIKTGSYNNTFTGAGVLLFERNNDPNKRTVILFESNGSYQDLGGSIDPSDYQTGVPVSTAAKRESFEETASYLEIRMNLNRVVNNINIFAEIPANRPSYRCYAVGLEENAFNFGKFMGNLQKLNLDPYAPPQFKEINQARRFYLKDIQNCINSNSFQCPDTTGTTQYIRERSMECLRELMRGGKNSVADTVTNYPSRHQEYVRSDGFSKLVIYE